MAARQKATLPPGITDSKRLSKTQRIALLSPIQKACDLGEGWVEVVEIDKYGLTGAMQLGVERALAAIEATHDEEIMLDGIINYCSNYFSRVTVKAKADLNIPIVGAASIYAKVTRDAFMSNLPAMYEVYDFGSHAGYGTKAHSALLQQYGVSNLHRRSYKPVRALL